jgi:hypothetical protein
MSLEDALPHLTNIGFRKRAGGVFTLDLTPDVIGWLGLNRATRHRAPGEVEINPVVGVRFQEVERLVAELCGEKFHAYTPPTVSTPLGYVMPEKKYMAWVFSPGRSDDVANDMVTAIATHGISFMRSTVELGELRLKLEARLGHDHQLAYRRPVAALVAGDVEQARAMLDAELLGMAKRTDLAATLFRRFAETLRERLASIGA